MIFFKICYRLTLTGIRTCSGKQIMKYLNVAEKNDAAKNIAAILSRGGSRRKEGLSKYNKIYEWRDQVNGQDALMVMTSVSGHLLNYEFTSHSRSWHSCDPIDLFDVQVRKQCPKDYENIKRTLEREVQFCQGLIIWTDCDREGENIGFEVIEVCKKVKASLRIFRAVFSEITATSIHRAFGNLQQPNKNVSVAVDVRQEIDLRTGAAFTRLQTLRLQRSFPQDLSDKLISYGSCQFPTLGFVVDRYKEIENFIPESFWRIKMSHIKPPVTTNFLWDRERLFDRRACSAIFDSCLEVNMADVVEVDSRPLSKWRPTPLDTIELEKAASRKLRINAKEVMKIAEKLYTQGLISYPRTETNMFPQELLLTPLVEMQQNDPRWGEFAQRILTVYGGPVPRQGRKSDHAHPPIHPTKYTDQLRGNETKVYEFIVRRFLACVSKDAEGHETSVKVNLSAGEMFSAKGLLVLARHYLDVYVYDQWGDKAVGTYVVGERFTPSTFEMVEGATSAPNLLTEADLITLMDRHGIGTDATQADHIETIKKREYVALRNDGRHFVPGTLGMGLVEGYNEIGLQVSLAKPQLRADFERDLKAICDGQKVAEDVRRDQINVYREVFRQVAQRIARLDAMVGNRLGGAAAVDDGRNNDGPGFGGPRGGSSGGGNRGGSNSNDDDNGGNDGGQLPLHNPRRRLNLPPPPTTTAAPVAKQQKLSSSSSNCLLKKTTTRNPKSPQNKRSLSTTNTVPPNSTNTISNNYLFNGTGNGNTLKTNEQKSSSNSSSCTTMNFVRKGLLTACTTSRSVPSDNWTAAATAHPSGIDKVDDLGNRVEFLPPLQFEFLQCRGMMGGATTTFVLHEQEVILRARTAYDEQIVCHCGQPAQLLTVRKEGPNQGRPFYRCGGGSAQPQCDMFLWESGDIDTGTVAVVEPSGYVDVVDRHSQETMCNCHQAATLRTVSKVGANTGRQFYGCQKPMGQGCKFFQWAKDVVGSDALTADPSTSSTPQRGGRGSRRGSARGRGGRRIGLPKARSTAKSKCSNCHQQGHTKKTCTK